MNDQAVHTPGSDYELQEGDLLKLDLGVYYNGLHTDSALTVLVSELSEKDQKDEYREKKALPIRVKLFTIVLLWAAILYSAFGVVEQVWVKILFSNKK